MPRSCRLGERSRPGSLAHFVLLIVVLVVIALSGCAGYRIAEPECGPARPQDCVYLLKVHGAIPWMLPGDRKRRAKR